MGSSFFKGKSSGLPITGSNQNQLARALNAGQYGARSAGIGAQKSLGVAAGINKAAVADFISREPFDRFPSFHSAISRLQSRMEL